MSPLASGKVLPCSVESSVGELAMFSVDEVHELEQDAGAALRVPGGPFELGLLGVGDGRRDLVGAGQRHPGLDLAGAGVVDIAEAAGCALDVLAADVVGQCVWFARHRESYSRVPSSAPARASFDEGGWHQTHCVGVELFARSGGTTVTRLPWFGYGRAGSNDSPTWCLPAWCRPTRCPIGRKDARGRPSRAIHGRRRPN